MGSLWDWLLWLFGIPRKPARITLTFVLARNPSQGASMSNPTYDTPVKGILKAIDRNGQSFDPPPGAVWDPIDPATGVTETVAADGNSAVFTATSPGAVTVTVTDGALSVSKTLTFDPLPPVALDLQFEPVPPPPA